MGKRNNMYNDPWERDSYETGSTRPPKQRGALVAFLLVLVLVLGGLSSALGIINIRLLQRLAEAEPTPETVYVFEEDLPSNVTHADNLSKDRVERLGLWGQTVSDFDRRFYDLPQGVLVTDVSRQLPADLAGIRSGDVIVSLGGTPVQTLEQLVAAADAAAPGAPLQVEFYRQQTRENRKTDITLNREEDN